MRDTTDSVSHAASSSFSCAAPSDNPNGSLGTYLRPDLGNYEIPWRIARPEDGDDLERGVITGNRNLVAHPCASSLPIPIEDAYMRRIVACVNACAGMFTEELEAMLPGQMAVIYYEERARQAQMFQVQA